MAVIDRNSIPDAKEIIELFFPDKLIKFNVLSFLANSVIYSNSLKSSNWNLNFDKNGKFIRLNTGQEYCIELFQDYMSVLCLKKKLKEINNYQSLNIEFKGYSNKEKVLSNNLDSIPDCLVKVPDSVGCHIKYHYANEYLPKIQEANFSFIEHAIEKTIILPQSKSAHSEGMISFLSTYLDKKIPNPTYFILENDFLEKILKEEKTAKNLSDFELEKRINKSQKKPNTTNVTSVKYNRNQYISEYAKRQANGICQDCHNPAPFIGKRTGEPFLETHHIISLADGGEDSIENIIALCPNCHRKRHFG